MVVAALEVEVVAAAPASAVADLVVVVTVDLVVDPEVAAVVAVTRRNLSSLVRLQE